MFHRLGLRCLLVALALLAPVLVVGTQAVPAQAATAAIKIKPPSGPPTTKVSVSGTGFGTTEAVVVDFGTTKVASATTTSTGAFSTSFKVPAAAQPGSDPVTAIGQTSGDTATTHFLVRTNWSFLRFGVTGAGYNPFENVLGQSNVGNLKAVWSEPSNQLSYEPASPPADYNGVLYTSSGLAGFNLDAYSPTSGALLWRGAGNACCGSAGTPAVAGGVAYVASLDGNLYAYAATAKKANCSGTPVSCKPLWTAAIGGASHVAQSSAVVTGGVVYVSAEANLYAFKAGGCGAATCTPLWISARSEVDPNSTPAVSGGMVFVGGGSGLHAYNASGCGGAATCNPVWTGNAPSTGVSDTSPAVVNGVVYLTVSNGFATLFAFSANGCGSASCNPLWTYQSPVALSYTSPAVANGKVYVNASDGTLYVFPASGGAPLWTAPAPGAGTGFPAAATVANGVVYAGNRAQLAATSADGSTGCSGTPKVCTPLWSQTGPFGSYWVTPIVANGWLFTTNKNGPTPFSGFKLP